MNKQRNSNFEVLRILSMFMIVVCHTFLIPNIVGNPINSQYVINNFDNAIVAQFMGIFGRLGNELFILISGYFLVSKQPHSGRIFKTIKPVHFYSWIILIISLILGISIGVRQGIQQIFPIIFMQYWFVTPFIVLVILSQYLNTLLHKLSMKNNVKLFFILVIITSFVPTLIMRASLAPGFHDIGIFITLYIGAGLIKKYPEYFKIKKILLVLIFIGSVIIQEISIFIFDIMGLKLKSIKLIEYANYLNSQESFVLLLSAFSLFLLFAQKSSFTNVFINKISSTMFGIYLIHANPLVIPVLFTNSLIKTISSDESFVYYLSGALLYAFAVFLLCSLIDFIRQFIQKYFEFNIVKYLTITSMKNKAINLYLKILR